MTMDVNGAAGKVSIGAITGMTSGLINSDETKSDSAKIKDSIFSTPKNDKNDLKIQQHRAEEVAKGAAAGGIIGGLEILTTNSKVNNGGKKLDVKQ